MGRTAHLPPVWGETTGNEPFNLVPTFFTRNTQSDVLLIASNRSGQENVWVGADIQIRLRRRSVTGRKGRHPQSGSVYGPVELIRRAHVVEALDGLFSPYRTAQLFRSIRFLARDRIEHLSKMMIAFARWSS